MTRTFRLAVLALAVHGASACGSSDDAGDGTSDGAGAAGGSAGTGGSSVGQGGAAGTAAHAGSGGTAGHANGGKAGASAGLGGSSGAVGAGGKGSPGAGGMGSPGAGGTASPGAGGVGTPGAGGSPGAGGNGTPGVGGMPAAGNGGAPSTGGAATVGAGGDAGQSSGGSSTGGSSSGMSPAAIVAAKLGPSHAGHFLIGMGNDGTNDGNDPAYGFGVTLDLHYHYLVGVGVLGGKASWGWPTWNSGPDYVGKRIAEATAHGQVPMLTYYAMAANGDGNLSGNIKDADFMTNMMHDYAQMLGDIAAANVPVVIHLEPDFWGYTEQASIDAGGPDKVSVQLSAANVPECAGMSDDLVGLGHCYVALTRARASTAILDFHASGWGSKMDIDTNTDPGLDIAGEAAKTVAYFQAIGADKADFVATDVIDRDVGCYEVGADPNCQGKKGAKLYWDETNATLPNFHQQLVFSKAITSGLGLPMIWWQVPFGVPSDTPGGSAGHYRDNRVHYMFQHIQEYVDAGGLGITFGTGAGNQTFVDSDGGQFSSAVKGYFASPIPLP